MDLKISQLPLASSINGTEYVAVVQGGVTKKTLASTLTGTGGGGGGISLTDLSAVNGITYNNTTGQFKLGGTLIEDTTIDGNSDTYSFTFGSINNFNVNAANNVNITANLGTLNLQGFDVFVASLASGIVVSSGTNIIFRTNGGLTRGSWQTSGALRVDNLNGTGDKYIGADVNGDLITMSEPAIIGGNTVASTMMIGTNSNFGLQLETNTVVRQTIDNDGLVTFNGTSGNAGVVRMRNLQILDFDGVTWRNALFSSNTNAIAVGTGYSSMIVPVNIDNAAGSLVIGVSTGTIQLSSQTKNDNTGFIRIISGNTTTATASIGSSQIYISTGNVTNAGALASQFSSSIRLDSGTVAGSATRGGVVFFNGNAEPTWNGLQRGIFVGNATAIPTGNPTNGFFCWSESGNVNYRTSGGGLITLGTNGIKSNGGLELNYVAKTSTYTIVNSDYTIDCTSGTFTVTLPTAVGITGKMFIVKNSGAGIITIATTSSQTIDGALTIVANQWDSFQLTSNGANWIITGSF
jgi:hypothetical protein